MRPMARFAALLATLLPLALPAQQTACKPTVVGNLQILPMTSTVFHNTRNLRVWLPPGYDDAANVQRKYPVLYILDGASAFDTCTAFLHDELHADETLTALLTAGKIPPIIAVGIDNASDIAPHLPDGSNADNGEARAREYLPYPDTLQLPNLQDVHGAEMPAFFLRDVMPAVASRFRVLSGGQNSALWGDSYAGAAALYIAIQRPDIFDRVVIESPSIQSGNGQLLRNSAFLTQLPHRIVLGVGTEEATGLPLPNTDNINANAVRQMQTLANNLRSATFTQTAVQLTVAQGARHTTTDFGKRLQAALTFLYAK